MARHTRYCPQYITDALIAALKEHFVDKETGLLVHRYSQLAEALNAALAKLVPAIEYRITEKTLSMLCYRAGIRSSLDGRRTKGTVLPDIPDFTLTVAAPEGKGSDATEQSETVLLIPNPLLNVAEEERAELEAILSLYGRKGKRKKSHDTFLALTPTRIIEQLGSRRTILPADVSFYLNRLRELDLIAVVASVHNEDIYILRRLPHKKVCKQFFYTPQELVSLISGDYFDRIGHYLKKTYPKGQTIICTKKALSIPAKQCLIPYEIVHSIIKTFASVDMLTLKLDDRISMPSKRSVNLSYVDLRARLTMQRSFEEAQDTDHESGTRAPRKSLEVLYQEHQMHSESLKIDIPIDGDLRILNLSELLIGNQNFDPATLEAILACLEATPLKKRPHVIVVSGIIMGGAGYLLTKRRQTLVKGLEKERVQFEEGKKIIQRLRALGILVVYSMGFEDYVICDSRTVEALRVVEGMSKPSDNRGVNWADLMNARRSTLWIKHLHFQMFVVYAYQLRCGRTLRSADAMNQLFGKKRLWGFHIPEYPLLFEAYDRIMRGIELDPMLEEVLELEHLIPILRENLGDQMKTGFVVCDNCSIVGIRPDGTATTALIQPFFSLTGVNMPKDPTVSMREILGQMRKIGLSVPDAFIVTRYHMNMGLCHADAQATPHWTMATPGLMQPTLYRRGAYSGITVDPGWRVMTTRRELPLPGSMMYGLREDGTLDLTFYTSHFLDKLDSRTERTAIVHLTDMQMGSITARPDLLIRFLSFVLCEIGTRMPFAFFFGGDHVHGRMYPSFPNESGMMGLLRVDHQKDMVRSILLNALSTVPDDVIRRLIRIAGTIGNHEWHTGTAFTGLAHIDYLQNLFMYEFARRGLSDVPFEFGEQMMTENGDRMQAWLTLSEIAGHTMALQHMIVERGAKGAGGVPILSAKTRVDGIGGLLNPVDVFWTGHWHHPQWFEIARLLFIISGSLAGMSGYEWDRTYVPVIGGTVLYVGGGEPPVLSFLSRKFLQTYSVPDGGFFSTAHLADLGYQADPDHNPFTCGFVRTGHPQDEIQRWLWAEVGRINDTVSPMRLGRYPK